METYPLTEKEASNTARLAGFLFLFVCLPLAIWDQTYVPGKVFVAGDPVATANNLLTHEFMFRAAIVSRLIGTMTFVFVIVLLYRLFSPVDKHLGRLMLIPILAQLPIVFVLEAFNHTALLTLKAEARPNFIVAQQQEIAYLLMRIYRIGIGSDKIILGLTFIPWGLLVLRSNLIPRIFGFLLLISAAGYVVDTSLIILLQRSEYATFGPILRSLFLGFMATTFWLLIKGVKVPVR